MPFHPYLFFGGTCREAFTRYQEIFGGELQIVTAADAPSDEPVPADQADVVLHAAITFDGHLLMGSDDPTTDDFGPVQGMMVSYSSADVARVRKVFEQLCDGGTVTQELVETFFSPAFGMCTDRFGTPWMVSADQPEA